MIDNMADFKVVLPTTTEEWRRDMNIAYNQALKDLINKVVRLRVYDNDLCFVDLIKAKEELWKR